MTNSNILKINSNHATYRTPAHSHRSSSLLLAVLCYCCFAGTIAGDSPYSPQCALKFEKSAIFRGSHTDCLKG